MRPVRRARDAAAWRLRAAGAVVPRRARGEPRAHWIARSARLLASDRKDADPLRGASAGAPLDVAVPVGPRDVDVLPRCLEGVERNLRDDVRRMILITPAALVGTVRTAVGGDVEVVPDETLLDETARSSLFAGLPEGNARWRAQQLLKLSVPQVSDAEAILVLDADTVLTRPRAFREGDRTLVLASREFHVPYYDALARLWRRPPELPAFSCVAHHMCFVRSELVALLGRVEEIWGVDWRTAMMRAS